MDITRLGAAQKSAPSTPRRHVRGADIDDLIRYLHNDLGLDVPLPGGEYLSPARQRETLGGALLIRIQFLCYKDRSGLDQAIEEFRQDPQARQSSPQRRTQMLYDMLNDPAWFSKERIQSTPRPTFSTPSTSYATPSSSQRPPIARFDGGASRNDTEFDGMPPPSPLSRKSKVAIEIKAGNIARQQMQESSSDYGSSWEDHGAEAEQTMKASKLDFSKGLDSHNGTKTPTAHDSKRRKIDQDRTEALTDPAEDAQANSPGRRKSQNCHWQIRDMVTDGFGTRYPYPFDESSSFALFVERARLRQDAGLDEDVVNSAMSRQDVEAILKSLDVEFKQSTAKIWDPLSQPGRGSLAGTISLNPKRDNHPLFQLRLHPMVLQSSRLERHFGSDRFLKVTLPSLNKQLPPHIRTQSEPLQSAFQDWLQTPKHFLGRTWCMYNIKELRSNSSSKGKRKIKDDHLKHTDVYFFATSGSGITPISLADLINWHFPIKENVDQPLCKGFARFSLSGRETVPTICFSPSQILMVEDIIANDEPEDTTFEDLTFRNKSRKSWVNEVMTDGCAMMSVGAALLIREAAGIVDFPSAFQGRFNGHKGMWHVSGSYEASNPEDLDVWIELRPSQRKVESRVEDKDYTRCEANRWCFELVSWSKPASHSRVHKDFLPVMRDRGVPRETILEVIGDIVDLPVEEIREAIQDVAKFTLWSHENHGRDSDDRIDEWGCLPSTDLSKCQLLIGKAGYTPSTNVVVAKSAVRMIENSLQWLRSSMSFVCIQSTSVFGIADPYGVLEPGVVHLSLSRPLLHEASQQRFDIFAGKDVLIARDPALRGSDMQKVHCVCHPRLAHLKDIIVMSSRGQIPLAAKLQGGDYDGDTFWVCADERLVAPFQNAPILKQSGIDELGIEQDKRRIRDIVEEEDIGTDRHIAAWFKNVIPFACRENQLGTVTNYLYKLIYWYNSLWHPHVGLVADLHGTIIDADKNGYIFGQNHWARFRRHHKLPNLTSFTRKFDENLKALNPDVDGEKPKSKKTLRSVVSEGSAKAGCHILDDILFNVINPKYRDLLDWLHENVLTPAEEIRRDPDLEYPLRELETQAAEAAEAGQDFPIDVDKEVKALRKNIEPVALLWAQVWQAHHPRKPTRDASVRGLPECIEAYRVIRPTQDCFLWRMRTAETAPTKWECFKVAVLAGPQSFARKKGILVWAALDVIQYLKSHSESGRQTIEAVQAVLKPKRPKQPTNSLVRSTKPDGLADGDDGETTDDDDYDDDVIGLDRDLLESFGS